MRHRSAMGLKIGKVPLLLLLIGASAPRFSECALGGRELKANEFPYTVLVRGKNADNSSGQMCLGVLYGSITVITAPRCFMGSHPHDSQVGSIRTAKNVFVAGETEMWYPAFEVRNSDSDVPADYPFTFAILNLAMPGVMVDAFMGDDPMNVVDDGNSTGVKVAEWYDEPRGVTFLTENGAMGVAPTPDKKVVAMKLISMRKCREMYYQLAPPPENDGNSSDLPSSAICAMTASGPVTRLKYEPVPPGYLCDSDAGSPFVYEDFVVGLLVKAFCDKENASLAVFVTALPPDDIDRVDVTTTSPTTSDSDTTTRSTKFDPITGSTTSSPGTSEGLSIHNSRYHSVTALTAILLIVELKIRNY